ncbi:MAG: tetratricopeptide repeat protein [Candidatus Zixiibacteriota bacterium]
MKLQIAHRTRNRYIGHRVAYLGTEQLNSSKTKSSQRAIEAQAAYDRGQLHHSNRRFDAALEEFLAAYRLESENDRYLFKVAAAYHNTGKFQEAVDAYSELITLLEVKPFKEQLLLAFAYKGGNLAKLGQFDEAGELIERALEMDSVSPIGLAMKGQLFLSQGKKSEALEFIRRALEIDPENKIVNALRVIALQGE